MEGSLINRSFVSLVYLVSALVLASSGFVSAQSATSSISGTVIDTAGGAIPGAAVVVKNESGVSFEAVTNGEGIFNVPNVSPGAYTVTISLTGFKTAVLSNVRVASGSPAAVKATLEVGQLTETVTVMSSTELINTQTATVASTLNSDQLNRMPTPTRNALNAVTFLPGVNTATTNRESRINGLPESFISITMDGVSNNDNFLRNTDSFFASVTPRQDAVEAVTVTTAVQGAQTGGSGAVSINFTTRAGTNRFTGSGYQYYRDTEKDWLLNTNYWFNKRNNLPINPIKLNQTGGRFGGPIVIPGLYDGHNKAFFFTNYEQIRFPNRLTRTRSVLHPRALDGFFRYTVSGQLREVNVLDLARANGQLATHDPTMLSLITKINAATQTTGVVNPTTDPLINDYVWQSPGKLFEHQPTTRIDYNLNNNHRLTGTYAIIWAERDPDYLNSADVRFPGAPNYRRFTSRRPLSSYTLRSTLSGNKVNEIRVGVTAKGGQSNFGETASNGPQTFEDQGGYAIVNPLTTDWHTSNNPSWRSAPTYSIDQSLTWQKGSHSVSVGGGVLISNVSDNEQTMVPEINLGFTSSRDPANVMFTSANFPNASSDQLNDARALYAFLTGRITSIEGTAALDPVTNKYVPFGPVKRQGALRMYSGFVQDSWRTSPTLTLTMGLRYDLQMPFSASSSVMSTVTMADFCGISGLGSGGIYSRCNMFVPNASGGKIPEFQQLQKGNTGYKTDYNNFGPSVGVAWRPNVQGGWLRNLLGDPEQATVRAGYTLSYERQGMAEFTGTFGSNPGSEISLNRTDGLGNLVPAGQPWPVLLRETSRLGVASFNENPSFPIPVRPARADSLNGYAPDLKVAYAGTWTASFQRSLSRDMAVEARYVGTLGQSQWSELNYNAIRGESLLKNGFLNEFKLGMANLLANNTAGGNRAGSFAYFGPGTGTHPLPTYLAYLNGSTNATSASAYTGANWTNTTFAGRFVQASPNPVGSAGDLEGNAGRRTNAAAAGIPATFFVPNPHVNGVNVTDSGAFSDYHALQIEMRRRLSKGLSANVNYQYAIEGTSAFDGFTFGRTMDTTTADTVRHAIKTQWDWTVPVGRGQRFGRDMNPILDGIVGGWSFNGVGRIQARLVNLGNVRLVGMTHEELQAMYKFDIRIDPTTGLKTVYMLPDDVIQNTRAAFSTSTTTASGYSTSLGTPTGRYIAPANSADCLQIRAGDCAPRQTVLRTPWFTRFDVGVRKKFPIKGRTNFEVSFEMLNVLDNINFNPVANPGTGATIFQTGSAYTDPNNTYDPGGRLGQVMFRINW
jgi:hypothetical protein